MRTKSAVKNFWTTVRKPSPTGRMTSPPFHSVTASNPSKGRPRRHFAECRTSGGRRMPRKSKPTPPQITQECSSAPSRKSTALPSHAPRHSLLKEKSIINARWREHFSTLLNRPSTVDPTVLDQIPQKPVITSLDLPQRSMKFRRQSDRPARENPLGWTGFLQRSLSQRIQWPSKHSTHSSPASGKKRMCSKNSGMPHSSPCSRTGAVRLTAETTGTSLSCPSLGRSWLESSSTASSPTSRRKTCLKPSVNSFQTAAPPT